MFTAGIAEAVRVGVQKQEAQTPTRFVAARQSGPVSRGLRQAQDENLLHPTTPNKICAPLQKMVHDGGHEDDS